MKESGLFTMECNKGAPKMALCSKKDNTPGVTWPVAVTTFPINWYQTHKTAQNYNLTCVYKHWIVLFSSDSEELIML